MFKTFAEAAKSIKIKRKIVYTDNIVFRLHYRYTVGALLICMVLVSSRQYFGEHIRCIADEGVEDRVIDTFCYFTNTFTVVRHHGSPPGHVPHPGVGPMIPGEPVTRHAYYQWVPYVLFLQAAMCFAPHFIWQQIEGGRIKAMTNCFEFAALASGKVPTKVNDKKTIASAEERATLIGRVSAVFVDRLHINQGWAFGLLLCELLNVLNIVFQVFLMQWFLGGSFFSLGQILLGTAPEDQNTMDVVFPKVTKCTFHKYGPSGSIQDHDALCIMALNVVNEKIYAFLWFWYAILVVLSAMVVIYRLLSMVLYSRCRPFNRLMFLVSCPVNLDSSSIDSITRVCCYSDWLFLHHIAKSLDGFVFMDLVNRLALAIDERNVFRLNPAAKPAVIEGSEEGDRLVR